MVSYLWYILGVGVILLLLIVWILLRVIKKRKIAKTFNIPEDVLKTFEQAEKIIAENTKNGITSNPHEILWKLGKLGNLNQSSQVSGSGNTPQGINQFSSPPSLTPANTSTENKPKPKKINRI